MDPNAADPNAALAEIRQLVTASSHGQAIDGERLAELIGGLDDWLTRGGGLPQAWNWPR